MFKFDKRDAVGSAIRQPLERLPTDAGEAFSLAYDETMRTGRVDSIEYGMKQEYQTILDDIEKRTGTRLINPMNYGGMQDSPDLNYARTGIMFGNTVDGQVTKINDFITRNKDALPGINPLNAEEIKKRAVDKALKSRDEWGLANEYAGTGASISGFAGSMVAGSTDPMNIAATVAGLFFPPARGVPFIAREAALNAGAEVLSEPGKRQVADTLGIKRDVQDFATDVALSGLFGAGFAGTVDIAGRGIDALRSLRQSKNPQARAAAIVGERKVEILTEDNPGLAGKVASAESGGNLAAKATTSSATGKYQFLDSTWNDLAKETGVPPVIEGQPDPRLNEAYQEQQFSAYTKRSTDALKSAGLAVDDTNLYLSHFLGQQGAVDFLQGLKANPGAAATDFVSGDAAAANKSVFFKKNGQPKTAQELYSWAAKKMGTQSTSLPEAHVANYDSAMKAMADDAPAPEVQPVPGSTRAPFIDGLEQVDPKDIQVDAKTFQFKEGGDAEGVTERLKGVSKWEQDFAGVALVYERADGSRFIADGHQRLSLAKRFPGAQLNARIMREADGWTPEKVRVRAAIKNIAEGTGSPLDAARIMRAAKADDLPPLPPTSALVRQGRALAELADEPFMMVVNGVVPENYGAIVGRLLKDPKMQEAAIRVLNKVNPENAIQAETIVRQVADTEVTTSTQATLFGDEVIAESLYGERAKVMDAALKSLKKDKQVFSTLVNQADRIEGAGNALSRETNLERMTEDAKVSELIQKLASRKGPISDALTAAARSLKEGARPGDATRNFLSAVKGGTDESIYGGPSRRIGGDVADSQRPLEPAEIKASQEAFEKQPEDFFDDLISGQVDEALANGRLSKDMDVEVEVGGTMVKKKIGAVLDDLEADQRLVTELTDCVEGTLV